MFVLFCFSFSHSNRILFGSLIRQTEHAEQLKRTKCPIQFV
uniref:LD48030p n=1 Tax=Drosophila melanogaster TaxID=7227 RepID=Q95RA4_DROME|nr:LD48030p [Drosophila melanogaster]